MCKTFMTTSVINMTRQIRDLHHVPRREVNLVAKALTLHLIQTDNVTPIKSPMRDLGEEGKVLKK